MAIIGTDLEKARQLLESGALVAIPTETVYGLAGNALEPAAVAKIFEVKERPDFDPLIVHVSSLGRAKEYVEEIPDDAHALATRFWPGPLTILLSKKDIIPDIVTAGLDRVGMRCPDHPIARALLEQLSFPLAAPSANPFGYVSPTTALHVQDQLGPKIPYILDGGPCAIGIESTVIGWENRKPVIYRMGGVSVEQVESLIGKVQIKSHSTSNPQAPGQLSSHYAPRKKFILGNLASLVASRPAERIAVLTFRNTSAGIPADRQLTLSPSGNLGEAAHNLFSMLRQLDRMDIDTVLAEEVPDEGLGKAINDRLRRAAATR
jgi:L-threonylcarbamoyladenylate synthase